MRRHTPPNTTSDLHKLGSVTVKPVESMEESMRRLINER